MMRTMTAAVLLTAVAVVGWGSTPAANAQPSCAELGGTGDAEQQLCRIHTTTPSYKLNLVFPTDYPDQAALAGYLAQNRDGFVSVAQMPGARGLPYEMDGTPERFRSGVAPQGTQSVVLEIFQDVGGPHPSTWYKSFTYDLKRRQPVTLDTLFAPGTRLSDALAVILPLVQRDLERQLGWRAVLLSGTGSDPMHFQNFAITDDELIFYFAPGELLPLAAGATSARVPRTAVPPLAVG